MGAMAKRRRRRKAGRIRSQGPRFKSGGLKYEKIDMTPEQLARRIKLVGVDNARAGDAGWHVGRLFIWGEITEGQRDAAERWQKVSRRYEALLLVPKKPEALSLGPPRGERPDDPDEFAAVKKEYEICFHAVSSKGRNVLRAVTAAMGEDSDAPIDLVRTGLEALRLALSIKDEGLRRAR